MSEVIDELLAFEMEKFKIELFAALEHPDPQIRSAARRIVRDAFTTYVEGEQP